MKIVKLKNIIAVNQDNSKEYLIYLNRKVCGVIVVSGIEIKRMGFIKGINEKYVIEKVLRIIEKKASKLNMIKFFIYSDIKHTPYFEKLGFIKRKVFYDNDKHKYFKMFKIV